MYGGPESKFSRETRGVALSWEEMGIRGSRKGSPPGSPGEGASPIRDTLALLLLRPAEAFSNGGIDLSFYVSRALGSGPIRFAVAQRMADPTAGDPEPHRLSTGPTGEYLRLRGGGLFFSDSPFRTGEESGNISLAARKADSGLPVWGWLAVGFGAILVILGALVVANKSYKSGYVEAAVGVALIALPFVLSAKERREARLARDRDRAEREAEENRIRELAGSFAEKVRALDSARDENLIEEVRRSREGKSIPYEAIGGAARAATARAGFEALSRWDEEGAPGVASAVDRVAWASGLTPEDRSRVRHEIFNKAWWHLLADDRLSPELAGRLEQLREALGITPDEVAHEKKAAAEFEKLRGIGPRSLPGIDPPMRLRALEIPVHLTRGTLTRPNLREVKELDGSKRVEEHWKDRSEDRVVVTNQRFLVGEGKAFEVDIRKIWDVEVDVDRDLLTIIEGAKKRTHHIRVPDPIVTAGLIQAAAGAPLKPKGLV